jgi:hypothetical protein
VTVRFTPTSSGTRTGAVTITSNANNSPTSVGLTGSGIGTDTNIALGRPATASSSVNGALTPNLATDGDANTYWESANNAFPQWIQVDLGTTYSVGKVTLKLPPQAAWGTRSQTLQVQTSTNGTSFGTVASGSYQFTSPTNVVNITFTATNAQFVRINVTANTGWPAGQLSELEVYPSGGTPPNSATLSANPSSLTFATQALNTTSGSQAVSRVQHRYGVGRAVVRRGLGDFLQSNTCGTSIAAGASCTVNVSFRPTAVRNPDRDADHHQQRDQQPHHGGAVGHRPGHRADQPRGRQADGRVQPHRCVPVRQRTDGNQATYWESQNNAFPQWVQVDLGSAQSASRIVLQLPAGWGARNETLSILGSTDGVNFTHGEGVGDVHLQPRSNNTVTITFTATTQRYFRLNFTANTAGRPARSRRSRSGTSSDSKRVPPDRWVRRHRLSGSSSQRRCLRVPPTSPRNTEFLGCPEPRTPLEHCSTWAWRYGVSGGLAPVHSDAVPYGTPDQDLLGQVTSVVARRVAPP